MHRVNVVDPVIEREDEILPDIAAPFPPVYVRSVNAHEAILADPPELIETAELDIVTAEIGVADAIVRLVRDTFPLRIVTMGDPTSSLKLIFPILTTAVDD